MRALLTSAAVAFLALVPRTGRPTPPLVIDAACDPVCHPPAVEQERPASAALRMRQAFPSILPSDAEPETVAAWLAALDTTSDPDWLAELRTCATELVSGRATDTDTDVEIVGDDDFGDTLLPPLPPLQAATTFHGWLIARAHASGASGTCTLSSTELSIRYAEHAREIGREETPRYRRELVKLPGVTRDVVKVGVRQHGTAGARKKERRNRETKWSFDLGVPAVAAVAAPVAPEKPAHSMPARADRMRKAA